MQKYYYPTLYLTPPHFKPFKTFSTPPSLIAPPLLQLETKEYVIRKHICIFIKWKDHVTILHFFIFTITTKKKKWFYVQKQGWAYSQDILKISSNFSLNILIKCILIKKKACTLVDYATNYLNHSGLSYARLLHKYQ